MNVIKQKEDVRKYFDKSENWREKLYVDRTHFFNRLLIRRKDYTFDMLDQIPELKEKRALDIGCGPGAYIEELMKRGFDSYGVDISQEMLNVCKIRLNITDEIFQTHFKQGDIENIQFDDKMFDLVICVGVLGVLQSDDKALSEIFRVLKPGGYLLLTVENKISLSNLDYILRRKLQTLFQSSPDKTGEIDLDITIPSAWFPGQADVYYKLYDPHKLNLFMKGKGFRLIDFLTIGCEFRIVRRYKLLPESLLSAIEVRLEKLMRRHRIPYLSYSGQFYTGLFQKQ